MKDTVIICFSNEDRVPILYSLGSNITAITDAHEARILAENAKRTYPDWTYYIATIKLEQVIGSDGTSRAIPFIGEGK